MDRRKFLQTVAVGAGVVGAGSCAHLGSPLLVTNAEVLALVEKLKEQLNAIDEGGATRRVLQKAPKDLAASPEAETLLKGLREASRTLLLAGTFHSMNEDERMHPAVQQLMLAAAPEMCGTVHSMHQYVLATTQEQRASVTRRLREDPALLEQAARSLDAESAALGVSAKSRARMRALFRQVGARMKQSTGLAIEEYSRKVERIEARLADEAAVEREAIARSGEAAYFAMQERLRASSEAWAKQLGTSRAVTMRDESFGPPPEARKSSAAKLAGMGLGVIGSGVLVALGGSAFVGPFALTAGVLLFAIGLVMLLIAGVAGLVEASTRK